MTEATHNPLCISNPNYIKQSQLLPEKAQFGALPRHLASGEKSNLLIVLMGYERQARVLLQSS